MADKNDDFRIPASQVTDLEAIRPVDETRFTAAMDAVVRESEDMRLRYMKKQRNRNFLAMTLGGFLALGGAAGFGWFFLVKFDLVTGVLCMVPAVLIPFMMNWWADAPVKKYVRDYKIKFMPQMAQALGGFKYKPNSGIPREVIGKTGVVPSHDKYHAEDCFLGIHKGVRVIFSEAKLHNKKTQVFQGIFVLLETSNKIFDGHTIITADQNMAKQYAPKRWAKLSPVQINVENPAWNRFLVYSDKPEDAALLVGEKLLKELSEASDIFGQAPLTAVLFRGKYIFLMIPHEGDMFEPSNMFVPVSTKQHAVKCKKEIERILEIIDVFEIYKANLKTPVS